MSLTLIGLWLWFRNREKVLIITLKDGTQKIAHNSNQFREITKEGFSHYVNSFEKKTKTPKPPKQQRKSLLLRFVRRIIRIFKRRRKDIW